ncbi:MAG: hypothetical protein ACXVY8_10470, partial [Gaiellaceae bacterium]
RLVTLEVPASGADPLLLVEPATLALLLVVVAQRPLAVRRSALANCVIVASLVIAVSALNPKQGGLAVGAAGLLFLLMPTAGFWIGRSLCDDEAFARILKLLGLLAVPVAAYGLLQTFDGFPRWDQLWILQSQTTYQALNVGAAVRAFSTFPSFAEYAYFLGAGLLAWLVFGLRSLRFLVAGLVAGLLGLALVLASVRLVLFLLVAALVAMLLARMRVPGTAAALVVAVTFFGVSAVVSQLAPPVYAPGATGALLQHQFQGLANPLDPQSSTLLTHLSLLTGGIRSAVSHPLGFGAGSVSIAAVKFGGAAHSTEADPSNLAVAAGMPGLLAYLALAALALTRAYRLALARRDALSIGALGLLILTFLQWFNGGQYGIALLVWLTLGWLDRSSPAEGREHVPTPALSGR